MGIILLLISGSSFLESNWLHEHSVNGFLSIKHMYCRTCFCALPVKLLVIVCVLDTCLYTHLIYEMFKIYVECYQQQNCMARLINEVTVLNGLKSYSSLYYARQIENLSERQLQITFFPWRRARLIETVSETYLVHVTLRVS